MVIQGRQAVKILELCEDIEDKTDVEVVEPARRTA